MLRKASAFGRGGFCRMASASRYLSIPLPNGSRISVLLSLPFALIHIASLLIFFIPFHWYDLFAEGRALVGGASPPPSPAFGPGTGFAFADAFRVFLVARRLDHFR